LFLSLTVFVCCIISNLILNKEFRELISKISETNLLKFYQNCINSFVWVFLMVAFVTLTVVLIEALHRGAMRDHKENMDRYKQLR